MGNESLSASIMELKTILIKYFSANLNLGKAVLIEKISKVGTYFFTMVSSIVIIACLLIMLVLAFSFWYGDVYGNIYEGFLISALFYLVIGALLYFFRKSIFSDTIIRNLGEVFYEDDDK